MGWWIVKKNRSLPRRRILKGAIATFNQRHSTLACVVKDISEHGCRLAVPGSINLPDTFELIIELDGWVVPCAVIWRRADEVGATFTGPIQKRPPERVQVVKLGNTTNRQLIRKKPT